MNHSQNDRREAATGFLDQMRDFLRRNLSWFLAIGLALLLIQDVFGTHGVIAMRRSQQEAARVRKDIDVLNHDNQKLEQGVQSLKSDPAAIERIAREDMGLARPGEYVFKIQPKSGANHNDTTPGGDSSQH